MTWAAAGETCRARPHRMLENHDIRWGGRGLGLILGQLLRYLPWG
jgi:hypothetical protein